MAFVGRSGKRKGRGDATAVGRGGGRVGRSATGIVIGEGKVSRSATPATRTTQTPATNNRDAIELKKLQNELEVLRTRAEVESIKRAGAGRDR